MNNQIADLLALVIALLVLLLAAQAVGLFQRSALLARLKWLMADLSTRAEHARRADKELRATMRGLPPHAVAIPLEAILRAVAKQEAPEPAEVPTPAVPEPTDEQRWSAGDVPSVAELSGAPDTLSCVMCYSHFEKFETRPERYYGFCPECLRRAKELLAQEKCGSNGAEHGHD